MGNQLQKLGYCEKAIELKREIEGNFMLLAEYLYYIKENQMYEPQWSSFIEFSDELKLSQNTINKLIQIYKTFIIGYGFTSNQIKNAGGFSLLQDILPMIHSRKTAEKWLELSTTLTRADLRKELTEAKTGKLMKNCLHEDFYTLKVCRDCGDKIRDEAKT